MQIFDIWIFLIEMRKNDTETNLLFCMVSMCRQSPGKKPFVKELAAVSNILFRKANKIFPRLLSMVFWNRDGALRNPVLKIIGSFGGFLCVVRVRRKSRLKEHVELFQTVVLPDSDT